MAAKNFKFAKIVSKHHKDGALAYAFGNVYPTSEPIGFEESKDGNRLVPILLPHLNGSPFYLPRCCVELFEEMPKSR